MSAPYKRVIALLLVMALLAIALAACGGDEPSGSTATTGETTASAPKQEASEPPGRPAAGSSQFLTPGGDNSIQTAGREAGASERADAEAVLNDYLDARARGDFDQQCTLLAQDTLDQFEELLSRSPQFKGKADCASVLALLTGELPAAARANPMKAGLAVLRVEGERGFAIFRGPENAGYFVQMIREDGEWKVGALAPSELP
jgi:hypothetical protein